MLHGSIEINRQVLFVWRAVRQQEFLSENYDHLYKWTVIEYDKYGDPVEDEEGEPRILTGELRHKYSDGAMELTRKVMAAALEERSKTKLDTA